MEYNEKQVQLIETAERLFATKGFEGTSVRDIAQEAGINIAMISYYFGSKEKLLEAIFIYRIGGTRLTLETIVNNTAYTPLQKINVLIDSYVEKIMGNQCFYRLMAQDRAISELHKIDGLVYETKLLNMELTKKIIHEGQKAGTFRKPIDVPMMMSTMIGTSNHFLASEKFYKKVSNLEDMPQDEFEKHQKKKLSHHLKTMFKAILTYDK